MLNGQPLTPPLSGLSTKKRCFCGFPKEATQMFGTDTLFCPLNNPDKKYVFCWFSWPVSKSAVLTWKEKKNTIWYAYIICFKNRVDSLNSITNILTSQKLTVWRFELNYKWAYFIINEPEKKAIPTATIYLYHNLNLHTVSICDIRIRDRI